MCSRRRIIFALRDFQLSLCWGKSSCLPQWQPACFDLERIRSELPSSHEDELSKMMWIINTSSWVITEEFIFPWIDLAKVMMLHELLCCIQRNYGQLWSIESTNRLYILWSHFTTSMCPQNFRFNTVFLYCNGFSNSFLNTTIFFEQV